MPQPSSAGVRLYDGDSDALVSADLAPERVSLLPGQGGVPEHGALASADHLRIMWGQDMLRDVLDGRYRAIVVGVNDQDNSHGIIARIVELIQTSQWTPRAVTSFARMFQESVAVHAARDREPYVLKFDLDRLLVLGLLRPKGRDHFTLEDLERGFATVTKMLSDRRDRLPVACVSFLNARANRLVGPDGREPSFESVLRVMYAAGFRGDVYTAPAMWKLGHVGVFPTFPFPAGVSRMREGSS
ncbi:MAG: hypothetical protein AB7K52_14875 [Phycisphaerales bacterium]